ncbi:UNVERIFIED_CONTAM: hypothetical protein GTU68_055880 [Idotea baltica]|nr:hypothetical protein [Idotea baltica]
MLRAITALGPAYIKFGQLMSTRPDVVGVEMADELKVLQDSLPPFAQSAAIAEIEHELGAKLGDIYASFSDPIAAASIAQVHDAVLASNGQRVAVKVLRPDVERAFRRDIDAFYFGAGMVELLSPASRRLRPKAVIAHFDSVVEGELDLRMEASAAAEFAANTQNDAGFHVPSVNWDQSGRSVMTLDWADGISVGNLSTMQASGVDLKEFGARIIQMFLRHALRDGFFHADMHQGNLKLAPNGDLIALDFGIMGRIDEYTRRVYAEILMGFIRKDYKRVAEVHFEAGYVPADQDVDAFAQALRSVGEPIFGQGAEQISMAKLLSHLFDVTERFGMETRTELILLQRTMVVVEGVARSLDSDLNIWTVARPEVENYIKDHLGPRAMAKDLVKTAQVLSRFGPRLPQIVEGILLRNTESEPAPKSTGKALLVGVFLAGGICAVILAWILHQL